LTQVLTGKVLTMLGVAPTFAPHLFVIYISAHAAIVAAGPHPRGQVEGTLATSASNALVREQSIRVVVAADGSVNTAPTNLEIPADPLPPSLLTAPSLPTEASEPIPGNGAGDPPFAPPLLIEEKPNFAASLIQQYGGAFKPLAGLFQLLPVPVGFSHEEFYEHTNIKSFVVLVAVIALLLMFDAFFLQRSMSSRSLKSCLMVTLLWQLASLSFASYVFFEHGRAAGAEWLLGYVLEYSFSVDNLSVFGFVFLAYETPDKMVHKLLFRGLIIGLVTRTLLFASIGYVYAEMEVIIYIFGALLIYTGLSSFYADVFAEDDESSPFMQKVMNYLSKVLRIWPHHDAEGRFFVRVKADGSDDLCENTEEEGRLHCTLLVPIIITIEVCDLMFAVDSTTAVMFQVKDFFLCCSCTIFAMAGCRTLYFLVHIMMRTFYFVKFGISITLAYIGLELCLHHVYDVPAWITVLVVVGVLLISVLASVLGGKGCMIGCIDSGYEAEKDERKAGFKQNAGTGSADSDDSVAEVQVQD